MNTDAKILYKILADWIQQSQYINTREGLSQDHKVGLTLTESMLLSTNRIKEKSHIFKICQKVFDNSLFIYSWLKTLSQTRNS